MLNLVHLIRDSFLYAKTRLGWRQRVIVKILMATVNHPECQDDARAACIGFTEGCWIGFNDRDGDGIWNWVSENSYGNNYTDWEPNEPSGDGQCVHIWNNNHNNKWNDRLCSIPHWFLCDGYYVTSNSVSYVKVHFLMTWSQANAYCNYHYNGLASIHNANENMEVYNLRNDYPDCWIGLNINSEGTWLWSDNSYMDYVLWNTNEPSGDGDCGQIVVTANWNDISCSYKYYPICNRYSPTPSPTPTPTRTPTTSPTDVPSPSPVTSSPTFDPTCDPTNDPSQQPTIYPSVEPSTNPTRHPTIDPTWDPTPYPSTEPTLNPSINPTADPTKYPSSPPTNDPTAAPYPTNRPTPYPTKYPTRRPTPSPTPLPTRPPTTSPTAVPSSSPVTPNPTLDPTNDPTISPTKYPSAKPSQQPTIYPSAEPSTNPTKHLSNPPTNDATAAPIKYVPRVTFRWTQPQIPSYFLHDPYSRFEATIDITTIDQQKVLQINALCSTCFIWQYKKQAGHEWINIEPENNPRISVAMNPNKEQNTITNMLTIQSSRTIHAGYCADENDIYRLFQPDDSYQLRMSVTSANNEYMFSDQSKPITVTTNSLPSNGDCEVLNIDSIKPTENYNLFCDNWSNQNDLNFNAMISNVLMNDEFVSDPSLGGIAPSGNISITVLIQNQSHASAISCYHINAAFRTFQKIATDINSSSNDTIASIVEDTINFINNITKPSSLPQNKDSIVSIYTIIADLYSANLTSQGVATQLVNNIVSNMVI